MMFFIGKLIELNLQLNIFEVINTCSFTDITSTTCCLISCFLAQLAIWSALTHVGIALDHLPLRWHFRVRAPFSSSPESQLNVMLSPIE